MIKRLTVTIEGVDDCDLELALEEVTRLVADGYETGFNHNDSGAYHFEIEDASEPELAWAPSADEDALADA